MSANDAEGPAGSPIRRIPQIEALASPIRQEIVDTVQAVGPCSVNDIAREIHRTAETLYYHVAKLAEVGLLREVDMRQTPGRPEVLYETYATPLSIRYDAEDPTNREAVTSVVRSMLRVAERDFRDGFVPGLAVASGSERNLWAARTKGWVRQEDLAELNGLLRRLGDLLVEGDSSAGGSLVALTWILAPVVRADPPGTECLPP